MKLEDGPIPLYKQVKNEILEEIKSLKVDSKISSEREYSEKFNVSRITVRHALDELVKEKNLIRITGKGTYVADLDKSSEFSQIISFTEDMNKQNKSSFSKIIKFEIINAKKELADKLKIEPSNKIYRLYRLRHANNTAMAIQDSYIIYDYCPRLNEYDFSKNSLYKVLEESFGLKLSYSRNTLESRIANNEERKIFEIKELISVFVLDQVSYLNSGKPIEYVKSIYRSDKYKFTNIAFSK